MAKAKKPAKKVAKAKKPAKQPVKAKKAGTKAGKTVGKKEAPIRPVRPGVPIARPNAGPVVPPPPMQTAPAVPVRVVPPAPPGELGAVRDVGRLLRHGEAFGAHKIEIRHLPNPVVVTSGRIAVADPLTPASGRVLARQVPPGRFRVMVSVATVDGEQRIAAAVMHVGRPPIARWVIAHYEGNKPPKSADQLPTFGVDAGTAGFMDALVLESLRTAPDEAEPPVQASLVPQLTATPSAANTAQWIADPISGRNVIAFTSGWGDGAYASYWALDGAGQPVCLVIDFDLFTKAEWKVAKTQTQKR